MKIAEECLRNSETKEEEKLAHLVVKSQRLTCLEGAAVSVNVLLPECVVYVSPWLFGYLN